MTDSRKKTCKMIFITLYLLICLAILVYVYHLYQKSALTTEFHDNLRTAQDQADSKADNLIHRTIPIRVFKNLDASEPQEWLLAQDIPEHVSGGLYLFHRLEGLCTTTDLPTGPPEWDTSYPTEDLFYSIPYTRSSDGSQVITACKRTGAGNDWVAAGDVPLSYLTKHFILKKDADSFYYLIDNETGLILTHHEESLIGKPLSEVTDPLLPERLWEQDLSDPILVRSKDGRKYYCGTASCHNWTLVYYQTPSSLLKEVQKEGLHGTWKAVKYDPWAVVIPVAFFLTLLGFAIFLPKRKKQVIVSDTLDNLTLLQRRPPHEKDQNQD